MKVENVMEIPAQFRTRRPPRKEIFSKLLTLFLFGVFCAAVAVKVAPLSLPEAPHAGGHHNSPHGDDVEVFSFSTLSPEERMKMAELSARLAVPYLSPWGEDERPALFFMWHLLYRSIKPDLEHFTADLRNATTGVNGTLFTTTIATTTAFTTGPSASPLAPLRTDPPLSVTENATAAAGAEKLQIVIHVVETERGYVTTSLTRYLPEAVVFSVVVNGSSARRRYSGAYALDGFRHPRAGDPKAEAAGTVASEQRKYAEAVAAQIERVLIDPAAENITEASQVPGMNNFPHDDVPTLTMTTTTTTTTTTLVAGGNDTEKQATPEMTVALTRSTSSPRLFLCLPTNVFNGSYYTGSATGQLTVNYQVLLSPYVALRTAETLAEFDATLRAIFTRANIATFIALPGLWSSNNNNNLNNNVNAVTGGGAPVEGDDAQRRRAQLHAKELSDFDRWYGNTDGFPIQILQRALLVPEVQNRYFVSIVPLGSKRWAGAMRELFRVELNKRPLADNETTTSTPVSTATGAVERVDDDVGEVNGKALLKNLTLPTSVPSVSLFGCTTRRDFLQCAPRPHHASCERFSDGVFA